MAGRDHVLPEDVQHVLPQVVGQRLRGHAADTITPDQLVAQLVAVPIP